MPSLQLLQKGLGLEEVRDKVVQPGNDLVDLFLPAGVDVATGQDGFKKLAQGLLHNPPEAVRNLKRKGYHVQTGERGSGQISAKTFFSADFFLMFFVTVCRSRRDPGFFADPDPDFATRIRINPYYFA